jgi:phytol kinase
MNEILRKLTHLGFGLIIAAFILAAPHEVAVVSLTLAIFCGFVLSDALSRGYMLPLISPLMSLLERKDAVPGKGALFFSLGALFCLVVFETRIVFLAIVVLSVLDSVSTIFGMRFGKTRIYNHKSLEGSLMGIIAAVVALLPFLTPGLALLVAGVAGIVELLAPVDDNLLIPVAVCLLLTFVQ